MDDSGRAWMIVSAHLSTMRWSQDAMRRLRLYSHQLGLDLQGARIRADIAQGKLTGNYEGLLFWYYPQAKRGGALYLVQECAICRNPFPTEVQTPAEVEEFAHLPPPDCRPTGWTRSRLRHWLHARRAERNTR